ncbi:flavodoxin domain-containing protein [Actinomadura sp. 21ATH]|uniref:flavodoxin domain-containing protein n=1 Tax=Actinomadura sp. 21ATH TaxID=1735444 RepID=UPI0035BF06BE
MPRILVTYGSKRGGTAEIAEWIVEALREEGIEAEARRAGLVQDVTGHDAVIVGGALYASRWHRDARRFVRAHRDALASRPVWLFSSGPLDESAADRQPAPVRGVAGTMRHLGARWHVTFGGRLVPGAHGTIASKIAQSASGDYRDRERIRKRAKGVALELRALVA